MRLTCAARTDTGRRRENNEDAFCVRRDLGLFLVADGMGGHAAGEIASRLVVDEVERFVAAAAAADAAAASAGTAPASAGERLGAAFAAANRRLADRIAGDEALHGMATTAVALLAEPADPGAVALAHVGDSRAYRCRARQLTRLTSDHSWVEEQVRAGLLTEEAARRHPWRNVVTRAIAGPEVEAEIAPLALEPDDRLLLCSDGLTIVVPEEGIAGVLGTPQPAVEACAELVRRANAAGGPDNVTVVVVDAHAD